MRLNLLFTFALVLQLVHSTPSGVKTVQRAAGDKREGSYIVTLAPGVSKSAHIGSLRSKLGVADAITHADWDESFIHGFAARLNDKLVNYLLGHPDVASIEEDGVVHASETVIQTDAPWGLQRISQASKLTSTSTGTLDYTYTYDSAAGTGVDVYVVDTGIYVNHTQFSGRAVWGKSFGGYADADGNGHGTHVAGTVGGSQFGVAKNVSLIAVKVLDDSGSGYISDIVSALDWVSQQAAATGNPSIATMSLSGLGQAALDTAVASLTSAGIHVTVAAGNNGGDASRYSPARAPSAITVGATTITDAIASFSNFGSVVDIFAPGQYVISSWIGNPTATNNISGTSMATPHIAGLAAYYISVYGNLPSEELSTALKNLSTKDAITGISTGTVNYLAYNGV